MLRDASSGTGSGTAGLRQQGYRLALDEINLEDFAHRLDLTVGIRKPPLQQFNRPLTDLDRTLRNYRDRRRDRACYLGVVDAHN